MVCQQWHVSVSIRAYGRIGPGSRDHVNRGQESMRSHRRICGTGGEFLLSEEVWELEVVGECDVGDYVAHAEC